MVAAVADLNTPKRLGTNVNYPMVDGAIIYTGAMVALDGGEATPAAADASHIVVGRALKTVDNTDDGERIEVETGIFRYLNSSAGDAIALDDVGQYCYVVFDNQVALTSDGGTRPVAGIIMDVDSAGVWVKMGPDVRLGEPGLAAGAQRGTGTLVAGTFDVDTTIVLTASSKIFLTFAERPTGSTNLATLAVVAVTTGAAGVAEFTVEAVLATGAIDADCVGDVHWMILD